MGSENSNQNLREMKYSASKKNSLKEISNSKLPVECKNKEKFDGNEMHLVQAFERLCAIPDPKESNKKPKEEVKEKTKKAIQWDNKHNSISINKRSSTTLKVTCQKPFKLRTEQRGRQKQEVFMKKLQEIMREEQKQRIPIAQGLPLTTEEPENLIKPLLKESSRPVYLKLHTDDRAVERAKFDHKVAERLTVLVQYKVEIEKQQKLADEEEIRRLRKELVPKALLMPCFDKPFIPRRSMKHLTIPKGPKFHVPPHKIKCCLSCNDMSIFTFQL